MAGAQRKLPHPLNFVLLKIFVAVGKFSTSTKSKAENVPILAHFCRKLGGTVIITVLQLVGCVGASVNERIG